MALRISRIIDAIVFGSAGGNSDVGLNSNVRINEIMKKQLINRLVSNLHHTIYIIQKWTRELPDRVIHWLIGNEDVTKQGTIKVNQQVNIS